jgi:hypothetical protein
MAWQDRIKEAAYTSSTGNRLTFEFEDVGVSWSKKTTAYDFAGVNGTYVQQRGHTGRRFPMRCYFTGDDCDVEAEGFVTLINEPGYGRLEHPIYAPADVVPFGDITRRDDLKTAYNQVVLEVEFWETVGVIYPSAGEDLSGNVTTAIDAFNAASSAQFEKQIDLDSESEKITFKDRVESFLGTASEKLDIIAKQTEKANDQFNNVNDSINRGIDVLVEDPLTLAFQTKIALQAPARASTAIKDRLDAYGDLAADIFGRPDSTSSDANKFLTRDLFASTYMSGSVVSVLNHQFDTRTEALNSAITLLEQWALLVAWRDANYDYLYSLDNDALPSAELVDTGEAYQALLDAVGRAAGFLVEISFTLKQERSIVLTRPRTILDLGYELYGESFEDQIDFFINSNNFTGSEILEIPRGRKVKYYV